MLVKLAARSEQYAGTGTKKELYRQALSAGEEGSLRGGATRLDRRCLFPDEPNTNHFR
jgi:hypothetical protein